MNRNVIGVIFLPLESDENFEKTRDRPPQDGGEIQEDSLGSAIAHLGRHARTTGEESFDLRSAAARAQRSALVEWACDRSLIVQPALWENKTTIGGSEHDIWEMEGEVWKVTRPDHFGWTVLPGENGSPVVAHATPLEYLIRWDLSNRVLGDNVRLRGVCSGEEGVQVVISQRFIVGCYPGKRAIADEMLGHGFRMIPGFCIGSESESSFYCPETGIALFDAVTDNFIESQGIPVPIDLIVLRVGAKLSKQLLGLII